MKKVKKRKFTQAERMEGVREELIRRAKAKKLIEYGEFIYGDYGVARGDGEEWKIGSVLTEINKQEDAAGRPILSAICVLKETGMPESGFWEMIGMIKPDREEDAARHRAFWIAERDRVFDYWK